MSHRIPPPTMEQAMTAGGALCHFIASDPDITERFARWAEHCPGDLGPDNVLPYLADVHDLLAPSCPVPIGLDPRGR